MDTPIDAYTAKLVDGPLQGKTVRTAFLDSGDPQPRIEIPVGERGKRYIYSRSNGVEFASEDTGSKRPSAVDYRYVEAVFDESTSPDAPQREPGGPARA